MAKPKSNNRQVAKNLWINTKGKMKTKEIAEKVGVSVSQIRKWKCEDKWKLELECRKAKSSKKTNKINDVNTILSLNADGTYETIMFDTLSDTEKTLINSINDNRIKLLQDELSILTVREYRMMKRIQQLQDKASMISSLQNKQVKDGSGTLMTEEVSTNSLSTFEALNKLEEALNKIQEKKIKAIESICKLEIEYERLRIEKGVIETNIEGITNWLKVTKLSESEVTNLFVEGEIINEEN